MRQRRKLSLPIRLLIAVALVLTVSVLVSCSKDVPICVGLFGILAITTPIYFARLAYRDWQAWKALQAAEAERAKRL